MYSTVFTAKFNASDVTRPNTVYPTDIGTTSRPNISRYNQFFFRLKKYHQVQQNKNVFHCSAVFEKQNKNVDNLRDHPFKTLANFHDF